MKSLRIVLEPGLIGSPFQSRRFIKDEAPGFPLKDAAEIVLSRLGFDEVAMPDRLPLPFSTADVIRKKARRVYITYARFLEFGPTPGCSAYENDRSNRSAECIARFEAAYGGEREAPPTPALRRIPPTPSMPPPAVEEDRSGRFEIGPHLDFAAEVGDDHGLPAAGSRDPRPHAAEGAADIPSMVELCGSDDEDVAPAVVAPVHRHQLPGALILYEFACDPNSMLGKVGADCGVRVVRLCSRNIDFSDDRAIDQLLDQVQATPGASIHCSIECAPWFSWQNMNVATRGPAFQKELEAKRAESRPMLLAFIRVAALIYPTGVELSLEWPRYASGWSLPEMVALTEQFGLTDALCDGCAFGLVNKDNQPLLKPWRIVTSSKRLAANLSAYRCQHARGFRHAPVEGSESRKAALYPDSMARVILASLFPFAQPFFAPALPCRPSIPQAHRDSDAHPLKPIDVLLFKTGVKEVKV